MKRKIIIASLASVVLASLALAGVLGVFDSAEEGTSSPQAGDIARDEGGSSGKEEPITPSDESPGSKGLLVAGVADEGWHSAELSKEDLARRVVPANGVVVQFKSLPATVPLSTSDVAPSEKNKDFTLQNDTSTTSR